jgi:hypothetical protein
MGLKKSRPIPKNLKFSNPVDIYAGKEPKSDLKIYLPDREFHSLFIVHLQKNSTFKLNFVFQEYSIPKKSRCRTLLRKYNNNYEKLLKIV